MAYLTLEKLIQIANLSDEVKKGALADLGKMNADQKLRLSQICWESITRHCENEARLEYEKMLEEMADGSTQYGPGDFARIEDKVLTELLAKIEGLETKEEITNVKEEIQQHLKNPPQQ